MLEVHIKVSGSLETAKQNISIAFANVMTIIRKHQLHFKALIVT